MSSVIPVTNPWSESVVVARSSGAISDALAEAQSDAPACDVCGTITVRSGISASRGYDLVHTEQQAEALEQENERLKIDIARLKSPQRIKDIATKDLGMEVPQQVYFVHAKKGQ